MKDADKNETGKRGGNYPYAALSSCLPIADCVKGLGGGKTPISKSLVASSLGEDEKSQTLQFKLASCKTYGLIEGRAKFSLTEISKRYFFPTDETDRSSALLDALESPTAFKKLIERFDGSKLQSSDILANILHRESGVPESWKDRVAAFFIKSAQFAAAVDEHGFLRVKASRESSGSTKPETPEDTNSGVGNGEVRGGDSEGIIKRKRIAGQLNAGTKVFSHTETDEATGQTSTIYVETPRPESLSMASWELLNFYVQSLRPKEKK
jgi:hypothetical protein